MDLYWFARSKNFGKAQERNLFDCIECGACAYVCPSSIQLVDYYRFAKSEIWDAERAKLKEDELLLVEGKVQHDDYTGGLRVTADRLLTLAEARGRFAKALVISMNGGPDARKLQTLLAPYRNGPCPVRVAYRNGEAEAELSLPDSWRVRLDDALLAGLREWLPAGVQGLY